NAVPGDTITLQNGTWKDCDIELFCNGTEKHPIVFKAQNAGMVSITGKSYLRISGNYIVVEGLKFTDGFAFQGNVWEFKMGKNVANHSRITNCSINDFNNPKRMDENYWVAFYGQHNRVDHCTFFNKKNLGVLMAVILDDDRSRLNSHSIDNNNFSVRLPLASNAGEIIRVGVSQHCTFYSNTIIKDNLFDNCDGEAEIISIKSCGNIVRNNVFKECQGSISLRHGNNNTVEGNIFLGNDKEGTGGARIINEGNWVVNNLFYNCRGINFRSPLAIMNGVFNSPAFRYLPVRDAVVANNTFVNCTPFSLCEGSDTERTVPPRNVYFFNNVFLNNKDTTLYNVFDKTDSIYFANNIVSNTVKQLLLKGFDKKVLSLTNIESTPIIITNTKNILPDSLRKQAPNRLAYGFAKTAGFTRWAEYKKITKTHAAVYFGKGFKQEKIIKNLLHNTATAWKSSKIHCNNTEDIYKVLQSEKSAINIKLTGNNYYFTKPISLNNSITFSGEPNAIINFKSADNLPAIFIVNGGSSVTLSSLNIDGSGIKATNFITSDTSGSSNHFMLTLSNCSFKNFDKKNGCTNLYNAYKYSVSDEIGISNCNFNNNNCNLFSLNNETENKGYYNVEKMTFTNCFFNNDNGSILNIYRGGNDESTMGPKLFFTHNKIINCNNTVELINLFGVQYSSFEKNLFSNSNAGKIVTTYLDNVRALHQQKNNQFTNSGSVKENKFVVNEK
ncbi:MAG: right-handed parallel beta-helix repeat-containing protein, partial [Pedobacter sp.]|nr:right-handed parallel beta-helix repeat-containing protein [Chitinophagaceae bacterium]